MHILLLIKFTESKKLAGFHTASWTNLHQRSETSVVQHVKRGCQTKNVQRAAMREERCKPVLFVSVESRKYCETCPSFIIHDLIKLKKDSRVLSKP